MSNEELRPTPACGFAARAPTRIRETASGFAKRQADSQRLIIRTLVIGHSTFIRHSGLVIRHFHGRFAARPSEPHAPRSAKKKPSAVAREGFLVFRGLGVGARPKTVGDAVGENQRASVSWSHVTGGRSQRLLLALLGRLLGRLLRRRLLGGCLLHCHGAGTSFLLKRKCKDRKKQSQRFSARAAEFFVPQRARSVHCRA